jgi:hypothetical protein
MRRKAIVEIAKGRAISRVWEGETEARRNRATLENE